MIRLIINHQLLLFIGTVLLAGAGRGRMADPGVMHPVDKLLGQRLIGCLRYRKLLRVPDLESFLDKLDERMILTQDPSYTLLVSDHVEVLLNEVFFLALTHALPV